MTVTRPGAAHSSGSVALPFTAQSAAVARARLEEFLAGAGQPAELLEDSRLVVSELVGNAVRHARPLGDGTMLVGWSRTDDGTGLVVSVTDGGADTVPQPRVSDDDDTSGRGLRLVEAVAVDWWYETTEVPEQRGTVHVALSRG